VVVGHVVAEHRRAVGPFGTSLVRGDRRVTTCGPGRHRGPGGGRGAR